MGPSIVQMYRYLKDQNATNCPVKEWLDSNPDNQEELKCFVTFMLLVSLTGLEGRLPSNCGLSELEILRILDTTHEPSKELTDVLCSKDGLEFLNNLADFYNHEHEPVPGYEEILIRAKAHFGF